MAKNSVWSNLLKSIAALTLTYAANKCVDSSVTWTTTRNEIIATAVTTVAQSLAAETQETTDTTPTV